MAMLTISDVQQYHKDILTYGIQDFDDFFSKTQDDIRRKLHIEWWMVRSSKYYDDITVRAGFSEFDNSKLDDTQFTRAAVYHCLSYYILPSLTTFTPDRDRFREMIDFYKEKFEEEFDLILRRGVRYDDDGDSTYETAEKRPVHFGRLVR